MQKVVSFVIGQAICKPQKAKLEEWHLVKTQVLWVGKPPYLTGIEFIDLLDRGGLRFFFPLGMRWNVFCVRLIPLVVTFEFLPSSIFAAPQSIFFFFKVQKELIPLSELHWRTGI